MMDEHEEITEKSAAGGGDDRRLQIILTLIGAGATIVAAIIAGVLAIYPAIRGDTSPQPAAIPTQPVTFSVEIDGPDEAPLGEPTYFTILSEGAERVEWVIAGFGSDEIDPFNQTDQIFVTPEDTDRVGEWFTLVVTAYNEAGESAGARHRFKVAPSGE